MAKKIKNKKNKEKKSSETFSFDNEIVIGVTKLPEQNKVEKKSVASKKSKVKIKKDKVSNNKKFKKVDKRRNKVKKQKKVPTRKLEISQEEYEKINRKKRRIYKTIKYIMLIILFAILVLCAMFSPLFNIKSILIQGNVTISESQIISLSELQIDENIFNISKRKVTQKIKQNPYIEEVNISRKLPSTLVIKIEERTPTYMLEYASGYVVIDKKGYILQLSSEKLELPILQGTETPSEEFTEGNRLCIEDLKKLSVILKVMELANTNEINSLISRIDIENEDNLKLIFETEDKIAYLGDNSNLNTKLLMIKAILEKEEGKPGDIFVNMDLNNEYPIFRQRV